MSCRRLIGLVANAMSRESALGMLNDHFPKDILHHKPYPEQPSWKKPKMQFSKTSAKVGVIARWANAEGKTAHGLHRRAAAST